MAGYYGGGYPGQGNPVPQDDNGLDPLFEQKMRELENDLKKHEEHAMPPASTGAPSYATPPGYPTPSEQRQWYGGPGGERQPPQNIYSQGGAGQYPFQQQQDYYTGGAFPPQTPGPAGDEMSQLENKMTGMSVGGNITGHHSMNYQQALRRSHEFQPGQPGEAHPPLGSLPPGRGGQFGNPVNSRGMPISGQAPGGVSEGHSYRPPHPGGSGYEYVQSGHPPHGPRPSYAQTTSPEQMVPGAPRGMAPQTSTQFPGGHGQYGLPGQVGPPRYGQTTSPADAARVRAPHMQPNFSGGPGQYMFPGQVGSQHFPPYGQNTNPILSQDQYGQYYNHPMQPGPGAYMPPEAGASNYPYPQHPPPHEGSKTYSTVSGGKGKTKTVSKKVSAMDSESENEEEEKTRSPQKKPKAKSKEGRLHARRDSSSDGESKGNRGKERRPTKVGRSKSKRKPKKTFDVVEAPEELPKGFGTYRALERTDRKYKTIANYIANGSPAKDTGFQIRIRQILEFGESHSVIKGGPPPKSNVNKMLLWWKTTPGSARKLAQQQDGCIAFYDVITRAYAAPPDELEGPVRQTVLLCSVSLGKMFNSPNGFQYWADKDFPQGNDSVKGTGRLTPDRKDDRDDHSTVIPSGKVVEHGKYKKYELEYSEYLIFDAKRAKVRYAVDVEIIPPQNSEDDDSESF